jgi:protein-L-isoaspartate(D-aspartate) O-methyltransferase
MDHEREIDADGLAFALAGPPVEVVTGLELTTPELVDGLFGWLAITEPDSCGLYAGAEAIERGAVELPVVYDGPSGPSAAMGAGLVVGGSAALLARPQGEDRSRKGGRSTVAPLVVRGYGADGSVLADRLVTAARSWDDARRPGGDRLRVEVLSLPYDGENTAGDGDDVDTYEGKYVVEKRSVRLLVSWAD